MAKPTATAASTALPPRFKNVGADPRGAALLRHHHAVLGGDGLDRREFGAALGLRLREGWRACSNQQ